MISVEITRMATGEVVVVQDEYEYPSVDQAVWQWTEGNYGCDCNRALYFELAFGREDPDYPCGDGKAFRVRIKDFCGCILHDDFGEALQDDPVMAAIAALPIKDDRSPERKARWEAAIEEIRTGRYERPKSGGR